MSRARLAPEELDVELGLERLDLLAERRLLHAQPLGRPGDMLLLGDGDEIAEMTQLHAIPISYGNYDFHILDRWTARA